MSLQKVLNNTLQNILDFLTVLPAEQFGQQIELLQASIGEHTRHCIEMAAELYKNYDSGCICYDNRQRDYLLQTDKNAAIAAIEQLQNHAFLANKALTIAQKFEQKEVSLNTDFERELAFHIEHCIHHQALIKVAAQLLNVEIKDECFGISHATVAYKNAQAITV